MPLIDFSEVKELEPIPTGDYRATVTRAKAGVSKKGNPKIDVQWRVDEGEYEGRIVFDTLTFTEESLGVVKSKLRGMGLQNMVVDTSELDVSASELLGVTSMLSVLIEVSRGNDPETGEPYPARNTVKRIKQAEMSVGDLL